MYIYVHLMTPTPTVEKLVSDITSSPAVMGCWNCHTGVVFCLLQETEQKKADPDQRLGNLSSIFLQIHTPRISDMHAAAQGCLWIKKSENALLCMQGQQEPCQRRLVIRLSR